MKTIENYVRQIYQKLFLSKFYELSDLGYNALAMQQLTPLYRSYFPWSQFSMSPAGLSVVLNEIYIASKQSIVECGGGVSTLFITRLLQQLGQGYLYTIEHDLGWAETLEAMLKRENLEDFGTIIFAPLSPTNLSFSDSAWYDTSVIDKMLADKKLDLVLVDGPPAYETEIMYSRYPAMPYFKDKLADDYTIIVDDYDRPGEIEIVRRWEKLLGIKFEKQRRKEKVAIGRSRKPLNIALGK